MNFLVYTQFDPGEVQYTHDKLIRDHSAGCRACPLNPERGRRAWWAYDVRRVTRHRVANASLLRSQKLEETLGRR